MFDAASEGTAHTAGAASGITLQYDTAMTFPKILLVGVALLLGTKGIRADADTDIRDVLATQVDAWNKGNVEGFMSSYAETCTFMGKEVLHSREKLLARYRKVFPTPGAMGKLTFNNLEVREIGEHVAIATGNWHLDRTAKDGGDAGGYFSLVLKDVDDDWQIVLDHTTAVK